MGRGGDATGWTSERLSGFLGLVDGLEPRPVLRWAERLRVAALTIVMLLVGVNEALLWGPDVLKWDWMFTSGYLTLVAGLAVASGLRSHMADTLDRLVHRGAVQLPPDQLITFEVGFEARAERWAHRGGVLLSLVVLAAYVWSLAPSSLLSDLLETAVAVLAAYVVGRAIGRMTAYGSLGSYVRRRGLALNVQPGHLDGAGGLKPLGDFFFFQAMLLAVPAVFLAAWTLLIPVWPYHDYTRWREPYLGLLVVTLVAEVLAFVLPMWTIHQDMATQKAEWLVKADQISQMILELRNGLAESANAQERSATQQRVESLVQRYHEIEGLPTWPVDPPTRRRFTLNNIAMVFPLLAQLLGATGPWQSLAEAVERFLAAAK